MKKEPEVPMRFIAIRDNVTPMIIKTLKATSMAEAMLETADFESEWWIHGLDSAVMVVCGYHQVERTEEEPINAGV